jgi:hypothetical protein
MRQLAEAICLLSEKIKKELGWVQVLGDAWHTKYITIN